MIYNFEHSRSKIDVQESPQGEVTIRVINVCQGHNCQGVSQDANNSMTNASNGSAIQGDEGSVGGELVFKGGQKIQEGLISGEYSKRELQILLAVFQDSLAKN